MLGAILPLIGVATDAVYLTISKVFLRRYGKFTSREFIWFLFIAIIVVLLFAAPATGHFPPWTAVRATAWLLAASVVLACAHNLLFYWGLEHEHVSRIEPFLLFSPLASILIAGAIYPSERFPQVYIAVAIASVLLVWSHWHKHHLTISRGLWAIIAFIVLSGLEVSVLKQLLTVYSPLILYLVRCSFILLLLTPIIRPRLNLIKLHHLPFLGFLSALVVLSVWASYSAFQLRGISETMFVFTLSPVLVYWLSAVFLKEKWQLKNILASVVIIGLVIWITLLK